MVRRSKVWILSWPRLLDKLLMCNCTFIPCSRCKFILKSVQQNISFRCNTTDQIEGGWLGFRVVKCSDERRQARNDFKLRSDGPCDLINIVESRNTYNVVSLSKLAYLTLASSKCWSSKQSSLADATRVTRNYCRGSWWVGLFYQKNFWLVVKMFSQNEFFDDKTVLWLQSKKNNLRTLSAKFEA